MYHFKQISELELQRDMLSYDVAFLMTVQSVQTICNFNLLFLYSISDMLIRYNSLLFFRDNISRFKRKLELDEFLAMDFIIRDNHGLTFDRLIKIYKNSNE